MNGAASFATRATAMAVQPAAVHHTEVHHWAARPVIVPAAMAQARPMDRHQARLIRRAQRTPARRNLLHMAAAGIAQADLMGRDLVIRQDRLMDQGILMAKLPVIQQAKARAIHPVNAIIMALTKKCIRFQGIKLCYSFTKHNL